MKSLCAAPCLIFLTACGQSEPTPSAETLQAVQFMEDLQEQTRAVVIEHLKELYLSTETSVIYMDGRKDARTLGNENVRTQLQLIWEGVTSESAGWVPYWMKNHMVQDFEKVPFQFAPAPADAHPYQVLATFFPGGKREQMAFQMEPTARKWHILSTSLYPVPRIQDQESPGDFALSYFENIRRIAEAHPEDWEETVYFTPPNGVSPGSLGFTLTGSSEIRSLLLKYSIHSDEMISRIGPKGTPCTPDPFFVVSMIHEGAFAPEVRIVSEGVLAGSDSATVRAIAIISEWDFGQGIRFALARSEQGWRLLDLPRYGRENVFEFHKPSGSKNWQYAPPSDSR